MSGNISSNDPLFNKFTFLVPISENDKLVSLKEVGGATVFQLNPMSITSIYSQSVYIYVRTFGTDRLSRLRFSSGGEAVAALEILQTAIKKVISFKKPDLTDADIVFINEQIKEQISNTKYYQLFSTPSNVWTASHNFASISSYYETNTVHRPSVMTTNVNGDEIEGLVKYINPNTLSVSFNQPITGWIFLN